MIPSVAKQVLIDAINAVITTNGTGAITGADLNDILKDIVNAVVPTIEEGSDAPSVAPTLKFWRKTGDNLIYVIDKSQVGTPFVPLLIKLASGANPALTLNTVTNLLSFVPGNLDLRLLKDFASIDVGDLINGGAIVWDATASKFVLRASNLGVEGVLAASNTIVIPAKGKLQSIVFWTSTNQWVKIGDSAGASDYVNFNLTSGQPYEHDMSKFSILGQTIHLTGQNLANINFKYYMK